MMSAEAVKRNSFELTGNRCTRRIVVYKLIWNGFWIRTSFVSYVSCVSYVASELVLKRAVYLLCLGTFMFVLKCLLPILGKYFPKCLCSC